MPVEELVEGPGGHRQDLNRRQGDDGRRAGAPVDHREFAEQTARLEHIKDNLPAVGRSDDNLDLAGGEHEGFMRLVALHEEGGASREATPDAKALEVGSGLGPESLKEGAARRMPAHLSILSQDFP